MKRQQTPSLSDAIYDRLLAGYSIAADVVTIAAYCRTIPDIPLSDYHAAVVVTPLMRAETSSMGGVFRRIYHPETLRGFQVLYREVPEKYLPYGFDYDFHATVSEEAIVDTREQLEEVLARYVTDFSTFYVGHGRFFLP